MASKDVEQAIALLKENGYQIVPPKKIVVMAQGEKAPSFDEWWNMYQKKRGRKKAEAKWNKLTDAQKIDCVMATPAYVVSTPDIQYRKDPITYLNNESWNDEIINKISKDERKQQSMANKVSAIFAD
jgi:hypothetical protein